LCHSSFCALNLSEILSFEVGEGGGHRPASLFGGDSRQGIGTFIAWYAAVSLHPSDTGCVPMVMSDIKYPIERASCWPGPALPWLARVIAPVESEWIVMWEEDDWLCHLDRRDFRIERCLSKAETFASLGAAVVMELSSNISKSQEGWKRKKKCRLEPLQRQGKTKAPSTPRPVRCTYT